MFNNCNGCSNNVSNCCDDRNYVALQKARKDLIGELDAIVEYDDHVHSAENALAKATWQDIRDEELVHVGELLGLIIYLAPYQKQLIDKGIKEFEERKLREQNRQ